MTRTEHLVCANNVVHSLEDTEAALNPEPLKPACVGLDPKLCLLAL